MAEESNSQLHKDRNKVLVKFADHSFSSALDEINSELNSEKNHSKKTGSFISKKLGFTKQIICDTPRSIYLLTQ